MTKDEILDRITGEIYGKPWNDLTQDEHEDLKARLDRAFGSSEEADNEV